jgi:hypothetical protein
MLLLMLLQLLFFSVRFLLFDAAVVGVNCQRDP